MQRLELADYYISPAARIRVLKVLEAFGKDHLQNPEQLKYRLAPILAQSAEEQAHLYELFDQFLKDIKGHQFKAPQRKLHWWEKTPLWVWWLIGAMLLALSAIPMMMDWIYPPPRPLEVSFIHPEEVALGDTLHIENISKHFDTSSCVFHWYLIDQTSKEIEKDQQEGEGFHWNLVIDSIGAGHQKEIRLICDNPASAEIDTHTSTLRILCKDFPQIGTIQAPERAAINKEVVFSLAEPQNDSLRYFWNFGDDKFSRDFQAKHQFKNSGIYIVKLRVERPDQQGFCEIEQTHRISIGREKAYLQAKILSKDPLKIILEFGEGTWLLLILLGLGALYFWVKWLTQKAPEPSKEQNKIIPYLKQENTDRAPYFIPFRSQESLIRVEPALYHLADVLRQRQEGNVQILDVSGTIRHTIEGGGFPKVAYRRSTQPTDYLVLLDEQATNSHLARLYDYLIDFLQSSDVHITTFRYKTEFHRFWNGEYPEGISIQQLQRLFPHYRLIIIGDAHELLDPFAKRKAAVKQNLAEDFAYWKSRLLLTPTPYVSWTYREGVLYDLFAVFCGNVAGLQAAINYLETQNIDDESPIPDFETWKKISAPRNGHPNTNYKKWRKPEHFKDYLKNHPDLYTWFCALAVYPTPTWEITLAIGKGLYPKGVKVTFDNLLILGRIPLLQNGNFSPRLRKALLEEIDQETEDLARSAVKAELEAIAPLVKNSHAYLDVQSHLAIQSFALAPTDENNKEVLSWMLSHKMLNKKQLFDLNSSLEKHLKVPAQKQETQKVLTKTQGTTPDIQTFLQKEIDINTDEEKGLEEQQDLEAGRFGRLKLSLISFYKTFISKLSEQTIATSDLFSAITLTFVGFLLLPAMMWLNGTSTFYQMFFSHQPTTFIEGGKRELNDYFFIKENVVIDSAVVFNNTGVDIWESRQAEMEQTAYVKRAAHEMQDPMPWFEKAVDYRKVPYDLAITNRQKTRYNLAVEKYHAYLKDMNDKTQLSFAQQDFRNAMVPDSLNLDEKHGLGLTYFYADQMDSVALYYNELDSFAYFKDLARSPNLQTLYEAYLYEEQQKLEQEQQTQQVPNTENIPNIKPPEFILFRGQIIDNKNKQGIDGVKVLGQNINTISDSKGNYTIKLDGDFQNGGLTLTYMQEAYDTLERFVKLDYGGKVLDGVELTKTPKINVPSELDTLNEVNEKYLEKLEIFEEYGRKGLKIGKRNIVNAIYNNIELDSISGLFRIQKDGQFGYMDEKGEIIIPIAYSYLGFYSEGLIKAEQKLWGYLDLNGKVKIPFKFEEADDFVEGVARVVGTRKRKRVEYYINQSGDCTSNCLDETPPDDKNIVTNDTYIEAVKVKPLPKKNPYPQRFLWCLDNAHGKLTNGKCSPIFDDGVTQLCEYEFSRDIVRRIIEKLDQLGIAYFNVVPEVNIDNALEERVTRANNKSSNLTKIYVSIHSNAAPAKSADDWANSEDSGIETWHFHGSSKGQKVAGIFQKHLLARTGWKNRHLKSRSKGQFYVLRKTRMTVIQTENGFYNNKQQALELMKDEVRQKIADAHVAAILEIEEKGINGLGK